MQLELCTNCISIDTNKLLYTNSKIRFISIHTHKEIMQSSVVMEITREEGILSSVSVVMPTWHTVANDGKLYAKIPFLGISTYGIDEDDLNIAIKEAFIGFCIAAEKHGLGLEKELEFLGWKLVNTRLNHTILDAASIYENGGVLETIVETGNTRVLNVALDKYLQAA
jgi:hypothetical protein